MSIIVDFQQLDLQKIEKTIVKMSETATTGIL